MKSNSNKEFWLDQAGRWPVLPKDEVLRLAKIIQNPNSSVAAREKSIEKLIRHNLKLIPGVAKHMVGSMKSFRHSDHCLVDLYQMGAMGLRRAAEKFDPERGYTFSTYATPWIRQSMQRESYGLMSPIRVPENTIRDYLDYRKNVKCERPVQLTKRKRHRLDDAFFALNCISLDAPTKVQDEYNFYDMIPSKVYNDVQPRITFDQIVSTTFLNDFQKKILHMKYIQNYSPSEIAELTGNSVSKVRDNIKRSIARLRKQGMYNVEANPLMG